MPEIQTSGLCLLKSLLIHQSVVSCKSSLECSFFGSFWWFFVMKPTCFCEFDCFSLIHFSLLWVNWVWLSNLGTFQLTIQMKTCLLTFVILWTGLLAFGRALKKPVPASWLTENAKKKKHAFGLCICYCSTFGNIFRIAQALRLGCS